MSSRRESDFARLEQLLREADERAEQERRRAQEAEQRAEMERQRAEDEQRSRKEAEQRAELERRRAEDEEKKTKRTTFEEYIRTCHTLLSKPLRVQTDKSLSTQGSITSPKNKPCPTLLKPWLDFPIQQQELFERVHEYFSRDVGLFSSTQFLTELGQKICDRPLASEKDLEGYERLAVEGPTTDIISQLQKIEKARSALRLGDGIMFENHANTLSDTNEEVRQSLQSLRLSNTRQASNLKAKDSDQICVYKETDGRRRVCMVIEYKPSHKLSVYNLRAGLLQADSGSINLPNDIINRPTIPTNLEEKFVYHSEWLVAAALTQIYDYMVENGLEYSYLTTGEAFVFLHIKEAEPHTLYYHLAEPNTEAEAHDEVDILLCRTAVSQALTFLLFALDSKPRSQKWRSHTLETACRAVIDPEAILRQIPAEEKALTPPASVFRARIHPFERSPIMLRPRMLQKARRSCGSVDIKVYEDPQSPSGSSDESSDVETPSKPRTRTARSGIRQSSDAINTSQAAGSDVHQRQYCTQACLLGLVRRHPLDKACPNVSAHRVFGNSSQHVLDGKTLVQLILRQLTLDPDNGCEPLGKQGARGALFRLTLESYGYTFAAKGTVAAFKADLEYEGLVYRHLNKIQGKLIPVYLGNISLACPYFLDVEVRIVHMLLMSWVGDQAQGPNIDVETAHVVTKLLHYGVKHGDIRSPNVLRNPESGKVMLVDFERSQILKPVPILQEISSNLKRKSFHQGVSCGRPPYGLVN
jgi:hypothetical protein